MSDDLGRVLINHPLYGSLWLSDCEIVECPNGTKHVVGTMWDDSDVGSPYLPEDYPGESIPMNFPVSCIRKDPDGLLKEER